MATISQSTKRKLSLLQLAVEFDNTYKACRIMGYHRDTFYELQQAFKVSGVTAAVEQRLRPRKPHLTRVLEATEKHILEFCVAETT